MSISNGSCIFLDFREVSSGDNLDKLPQAADMVAPGYPRTIRGRMVVHGKPKCIEMPSPDAPCK